MLSKIIAVGMIAVFLTVTCMPVFASEGRLLNATDEPGRTDEHPWGGDHYAPPDPEPDKVTIENGFGNGSMLFFVRLGIQQTWLSVRSIFLNPTGHLPNNDVKEDGRSTPVPVQNATTDQGARNN